MSDPTPLDRALRSFNAIVRAEDQNRTFRAVYEYSVEDSDGATFSGLPVDASVSPQIPTRVPYSPSLAGTQCVVPKGTLAYVAFNNGDPTKPVLRAFGGTLPSAVTVDATDTLALIPSGNLCTVGDPGSAGLVGSASAILTQLASIAATLAPMVTLFNAAAAGAPVLQSNPATTVPVYTPAGVAVSKLKSE